MFFHSICASWMGDVREQRASMELISLMLWQVKLPRPPLTGETRASDVNWDWCHGSHCIPYTEAMIYCWHHLPIITDRLTRLSWAGRSWIKKKTCYKIAIDCDGTNGPLWVRRYAWYASPHCLFSRAPPAQGLFASLHRVTVMRRGRGRSGIAQRSETGTGKCGHLNLLQTGWKKLMGFCSLVCVK